MEKKLHLRHQAALRQLSNITMTQLLFEFTLAGPAFGSLAPESKRSCAIVIKDEWTRPV